MSKRSVSESEGDDSWGDFFGDFSKNEEDELEEKARLTNIAFLTQVTLTNNNNILKFHIRILL